LAAIGQERHDQLSGGTRAGVSRPRK
jgi:hypothetical protein